MPHRPTACVAPFIAGNWAWKANTHRVHSSLTQVVWAKYMCCYKYPVLKIKLTKENQRFKRLGEKHAVAGNVYCELVSRKNGFKTAQLQA